MWWKTFLYFLSSQLLPIYPAWRYLVPKACTRQQIYSRCHLYTYHFTFAIICVFFPAVVAGTHILADFFFFQGICIMMVISF